MDKDINILILSCGTRNKIVQYLKKELSGKGKVFATDCSHLAPALYEADEFFIVPKVHEKGYLEKVLSICKDNNIKGVLSLIDPELNILAKHKDLFLDMGVIPMISEKETIEMSLDKYATFSFLKNNHFPTFNNYIDKEKFYIDKKAGKIDYPVFIKPALGSASMNINKVNSDKEVDLLFERYDDLLIQEFMAGKEFGVDVYIDLISGELSSMFIKEKIKMRSGETDKSVSVKDEKLSNLIKNFVNKANFRGVIDIDVFKVEDEYYISEVNPRFGGGYPHAYEADINFPKMLIKNLEGDPNKQSFDSYEEGVYMMKYSDMIVGKAST